MERDLRMHDPSKNEIVRVASQFIPNLDIEKDAVRFWANPGAVVVLRRQRRPIEDVRFDAHINVYSGKNGHDVTHQDRFDAVAWSIHGTAARHVILGLGAEGDGPEFLSAGMLLPEMLRYQKATSSGGDNVHSEAQLVDQAIKAENEALKRDQYFLAWLEVLRVVSRDHPLILTLDFLSRYQTAPTRKLVTLERLNPKSE